MSNEAGCARRSLPPRSEGLFTLHAVLSADGLYAALILRLWRLSHEQVRGPGPHQGTAMTTKDRPMTNQGHSRSVFYEGKPARVKLLELK